MTTKKSAKKARRKRVTTEIIIELKKGYTLEDVRAAITPAIFKRLRTANKLYESTGLHANVIPGPPGPPHNP
jgi:hypothetical protein